MMATPVFGEFTRPAAVHLTAAVAFPTSLPDESRDAVTSQLGRLITTLARYLEDLPLPDQFDPALNQAVKQEAQAAAEARQALRWAAESLLPAPTAAPATREEDSHPAAGHLAAAADLLAAGRDLLHTHFAGPLSAQTARSYYAPVILSWPVTSAVVTQVAAFARQLAPWATEVSGPYQPDQPGSAVSTGLHIASRWLQAAATATHRAWPYAPPAEARDMLAAIPLNVPPTAIPPGPPESVPQLCEGITVTAQRLQHAAHAFAGSARWAPEATSVSWRRDALGCATTTHSSTFILRLLTQRATQLGLDAAIQHDLRAATVAMDRAWRVWYKAVRHWDTLTTGQHPPGAVTPVAAEVGDLALRTGRLARRDPHWTPVRTGLGLIRDPATLAADSAEFALVIAAVHHAADAITRVGGEDRQAIHQAAVDGRLYVPARLVPAVKRPLFEYVPAPWLRAERLLRTYRAAINATAAATAALDTLAITAQAPSRSLADTRMLTGHPFGSQPSSPQPGPAAQAPQASRPAEASNLRELIGNLSISDPAIHLRAAAIEDAAQALAAEAVSQTQRRAAATDIPRGSKHMPGAQTGQQTAPNRSPWLLGNRQARRTVR